MIKLDSKNVSKVAGLIQIIKIVEEEIDNGFIYFIEDNDIKVHEDVKKILKDLFTLKMKDFLNDKEHKMIYDYLLNLKSPAELIQITYPENMETIDKFEKDFENLVKNLLSSIGDEDEIEEIFEEYYKDTIVANTISFLESLGIVVKQVEEVEEDEANKVNKVNENNIISNEEVLLNKVIALENEVNELRSIMEDLVDTLIEKENPEEDQRAVEVEKEVNQKLATDPNFQRLLNEFFSTFR